MYSHSTYVDYILSAYKYIILLYCFFFVVVVGRFNIGNLKENARLLSQRLLDCRIDLIHFAMVTLVGSLYALDFLFNLLDSSVHAAHTYNMMIKQCMNFTDFQSVTQD